MKALSVRQPWAWLISNVHKEIATGLQSYAVEFWFMRVLHQVTKADYAELIEKYRKRRIKNYPEHDEFKTGGIVGSVEIVDCVEISKSPWLEGKYGFVLKNASTAPFRPMLGKLGFFEI